MVQAGEKGGTREGAEKALKAGKRVFAVIYGKYDQTNRGNDILIHKGAIPMGGKMEGGKKVPNLVPVLQEGYGNKKEKEGLAVAEKQVKLDF